MSKSNVNKNDIVADVTQFFLEHTKGEQHKPQSEFRGIHLKGRTGAELICDCCGDGDDCCGFN